MLTMKVSLLCCLLLLLSLSFMSCVPDPNLEEHYQAMVDWVGRETRDPDQPFPPGFEPPGCIVRRKGSYLYPFFQKVDILDGVTHSLPFGADRWTWIVQNWNNGLPPNGKKPSVLDYNWPMSFYKTHYLDYKRPVKAKN